MTMRRPYWTLLLLASAGCSPTLAPFYDPPRSLAVTTTGHWRSMIYLAHTDSGVVVIDLGWFGAGGTLDRAMSQIGASAEDIEAVFLTHSHRDHIVGWRQFDHATFVMGSAEIPVFTGQIRHEGLIPNLAERLLPSDRPSPGEVQVLGFSSDTIFSFGADTLRAYLVPGHTAGSAAYLFRGTLFVGDAVSWARLSGFRPDRRIHSDDSEQSRRSVASLWETLPKKGIKWVCTAHARCAAWSDNFPETAR